MKKRLVLLVLTLCLCSAGKVFANDRTAVVEAAVNGFVRSAYSGFANRAGALADAMDALCSTPSERNLETARRSFSDAAEAWSYAEIIRFGPVTEENRLERLLFWPDRKGIGLKQVQAALAQEDEAAADPEQLAAKSVAMQGFGALEFILFGAGAESLAAADRSYRCRYGSAIATNIVGIAGDLDAEWGAPDGFAWKWANPGPENPLYRTGDEAMTELFNIFVHELEMIRDVRLNGFLGRTADGDKPKQAIYWRSGGTVIAIKANLQGLHAIFDASDLAGQLPDDARWIAQSIGFEFDNADAALDIAAGPIAETLEDKEKREALAVTRLVTSHLSELFGVTLAGRLGLTAGFSSLDGD